MDTLHITTPADLVSLIGHSLGYWPHESLVCISLQKNRMGATLRLDLPTTPDHAHMYARRVGGYLRSDQDATAAVFAIFTDTNRDDDSDALFGPLVESLAQQLALAGMPIQAGWIVGPSSIAEFRIHPVSYGPDIPLGTVQSSLLNAELIFRGSQIRESLALALPSRAVTPEFTAEVETHLNAAVAQSSAQRTADAVGLWSSLIDGGEEPTAAQLAEVLAQLQIPELRDRLIADMPGLDLPMELLLFGESNPAPDWDRIDTAEGLLRQLYAVAAPEHAAAPLTVLGCIAWWKGKGSIASDLMDFAGTFDPDYRLARLMSQMLGCGLVAGWATSKTQAYRTL
ncbi:hypothetical protein AU252_01755 [Pseudarthrobacter sulfonivorans]|uniref:DUF4192 domain-containing protein n=1 Tax=Pseudarthrobacter sulfonivorans TaxID=121292 RepID=A0A0U3QT20_9MICC|nr:DUF4192 domain-containing protein [Pseudarthrobacter sulfonivorans]ALV40044.1 hypothetical protein AU252_01755 [Pseudarthrobacter sulfonivorans]